MTRKIYLDVLRIISCIAVIMFHISGIWMQKSDVASRDYMISAIYVLLTSFMVPVFVMISGSIFLDPDKNLNLNYLWKDKILKLVILYILWSIVYNLGELGKTSISGMVTKIVQGHYHMWYIPMTIGLYIIVPLLRRLVDNRPLMAYFLILSLVLNVVCLILYKISFFSDIYLFAEQLQIHFSVGWVFYFVLGYALSTYTIDRKLRWFLYAAAMLSQAVAIVSILINASRGQALEYVYSDYSVNRCLYVTAIFLLAKEWGGKSDQKMQNAIFQFSTLTLGVYLIHAKMIEKRALLHFAFDNCNPLWAVPCMTAIVTIISFAVVWFLKKIPLIKKWMV